MILVSTTFLQRKIATQLISNNSFFLFKILYQDQVQNHIMDHIFYPIYLLIPSDHYLQVSPTNDQSLLLILYSYKYLLCTHNFQCPLICYPFLHRYANRLINPEIPQCHHQENHIPIILTIKLHHFLFHFDLLLFILGVALQLPKNTQLNHNLIFQNI